ncbi:uncharacterized protein LOC126672820 [Mercurialis annua]|uniref:uncharacterized protein LOC126672820 n=1 Tax=Mercurialis annua TaxID=3986 RepID=UPI00215FCA11|nr:uncharacterized protein LOC126672820 [Mercurialis annua]
MKHVWDLLTSKKSMWTHCIIKNKLKLMSYWGITKPLNTSWNWRSLIKLRSELKDSFDYTLEKGDCSFWYDPWINGRWRLPDPMNEQTEEAWSLIKGQYKIKNDSIMWKHGKTGKFSITSAYDRFRSHYPNVMWWKVIWNADYVQKHAFILWFAIKHRLKTRDKLFNWGVINDDKCVFCNGITETVEYLFFDCAISKSIMKKVLQCCLINREVFRWRREWSWMTKKAVGKSLLARVRRVAFNCCIYHIWRGRNRCIFENRRVEEATIKRDMLLKLYYRRISSLIFLSVLVLGGSESCVLLIYYGRNVLDSVQSTQIFHLPIFMCQKIYFSFSPKRKKKRYFLTQAATARLAAEEQEGGLDYSEVGEAEGENSQWWLVGRFLTDKTANLVAMKNVMAAIWKPVEGVRIKEIKNNLFNFNF